MKTKTEKKLRFPKKFWSIKDEPTQNAIMAFFVYLWYLPNNWKSSKINKHAIKKVREYFGVDYGISVMLMWGLNIDCAKSETSKGRHKAMFKAFIIAKGMRGQGVMLTNKTYIQNTSLN